ncbi:MAG: hypothetical protein LH619_05420 [Chitinophagaceae bacterium]|nr:hypothetical protein [Chitinophagaceae bacterium]
MLTAFSIFSFSQDSATATKPEKFITKRSIKIDNKPISYTATAEMLILNNDKEEPIASFQPGRVITFSFLSKLTL